MASVTAKVAQIFKERELTVLKLIQDSGIQFDEVGVFGSYARGEYKGSSDIDFCIITDRRPCRAVSGALREEAELLGADLIFMTPDSFREGDSQITKNMQGRRQKMRSSGSSAAAASKRSCGRS